MVIVNNVPVYIVLWIFGFLSTYILGRKTENLLYKPHTIDELELLKVPEWFYILCGMPKAKKLPRKVMFITGFAFQDVAGQGIMIVILIIIAAVAWKIYSHDPSDVKWRYEYNE